MIEKSDFQPAWWLGNAHAQTLFATLTRSLQTPVDKKERFELPDGDFIDVSWAENGLDKDAPLVVILHGLGGDAASSYIAGLSTAFNKHGWRAAIMHFRGAGEEPNRLPRAYHSGDTGDVDYFLQELNKREPHTKKAIVGISMGGNVLLKWLGELGKQGLVVAAVAVSVPFQLRLVADRVNQGFSRIYQSYLLRRLRRIFARKLERYADTMPVSLKDLDASRCFWTFDEHITAPLHGYQHVHAYYRDASSHQYLANIMTPTLIIHALDDPFMTPEVIPRADELSKDILFELSSKGGHVGFITGHVPGRPVYWLDQRIPRFLKDYL